MKAVQEIQKHPWQFVCIGILTLTILYVGWLKVTHTPLVQAQYECPANCTGIDCPHNQ